MTLRLYVTNSAADLTPSPLGATYNATGQAVYKALSLTKTGANAGVTVSETVNSASYDVLVGCFVSPPFLRGDFLPLTDTHQHRTARNNNIVNAEASVITVWVMAPDGSVRGYIRPFSVGALNAGTGMGVAGWNARAFDNAFQVFPGDRLIIEHAMRSNTASATNTTWEMRYGGTDATDLASGDSVANCSIRPGWIELIGVAETLWTAGPPRGQHFLGV